MGKSFAQIQAEARGEVLAVDDDPNAGKTAMQVLAKSWVDEVVEVPDTAVTVSFRSGEDLGEDLGDLEQVNIFESTLVDTGKGRAPSFADFIATDLDKRLSLQVGAEIFDEIPDGKFKVEFVNGSGPRLVPVEDVEKRHSVEIEFTDLSQDVLDLINSLGPDPLEDGWIDFDGLAVQPAPRQPKSTRVGFILRWEPDLADAVKALARAEGKSTNAWIVALLEKMLKE